MDYIYPEKIKLARLKMRLSMDELAKRMGEHAVSKMAISKIERGLLKPSQSTLVAIADACKVDVRSFYVHDINIRPLNFRYGLDVSEREKSQIEAATKIKIQDYLDLEGVNLTYQPFVNPLKNEVLSSYDDAERLSVSLRREWEIGLQPIMSVYEMLSNYGITVLEMDMGTDRIDGVSTYTDDKRPFIVVNSIKNKTTERKRFTALHELAHLLFNVVPISAEEYNKRLSSMPMLPYKVIVKPPEVERLCNYFASAMLYPQQCVIRRVGEYRKNLTLSELISVRNIYGISVAAQVHRIHDLRIIDEDTYNYWYDHYIKPNFMEDGWGQYPIMETADTMSLLGEIQKVELDN